MTWRNRIIAGFVVLLLVYVLLIGCSSRNKDFSEELVSVPQILSNEEISGKGEKYDELVTELPIDVMAMIDNESALNDLIDQKNHKISTENAWHATHLNFDAQGGTNIGWVWTIRIFEAAYDVNIRFVRDTGLAYEKDGETYKRMYTVFRTEGNGYVYCFFDYRESDNWTKAKRAVYVAEPQQYKQFKHLNVGNSVYEVAAVDSIALYALKNNLPESIHLLKDGVVHISYAEGKITDIKYNKEYLISNPMDYAYDAEDPDFMNEEAYRYNLYILPQDYPQN